MKVSREVLSFYEINWISGKKCTFYGPQCFLQILDQYLYFKL